MGILGGGIAGLACGHYLAKLGHVPVVIEAAAELGRLGPPIAHAGRTIDRFQTELRSTDSALCGLLAELALLGRAIWRPTSASVYVGGVTHPVTTAQDLLRLSAGSAFDKLRARLGLAYAAQIKPRALELDAIPAADWLPRVFGRNVYERVWRPFMEARFGSYADEIPAYWFWRELYSYCNGRRETFGYLRGGIGCLTDRLCRSIEARGGEVRVGARVTAVEAGITHCSVELDDREERFDAVISTLTAAELAKIARARLASELPGFDQPFQGNVSALVISRRSLGPHHETTFLERSAPFQRVVEVTRVVPPESLGDRHLVYLHRACLAHSESYRQPDELVARQALDCLRAAFPAFEAEHVEAVHVSRNPVAEPIATVGQCRNRLPMRLGVTRFYLCTTVQAYPRRVGWDADVMLARETSATVAATASSYPRLVGGGVSRRDAEARLA